MSITGCFETAHNLVELTSEDNIHREEIIVIEFNKV
jgi:hypothetical protein